MLNFSDGCAYAAPAAGLLCRVPDSEVRKQPALSELRNRSRRGIVRSSVAARLSRVQDPELAKAVQNRRRR